MRIAFAAPETVEVDDSSAPSIMPHPQQIWRRTFYSQAIHVLICNSLEMRVKEIVEKGRIAGKIR